jgi:hypothetical protein
MAHQWLTLVDHRGLHSVIKQFLRRAAHGTEGIDVAAHDRLQILRGTEPAPEPTAVPEHHGEQPDDPDHSGLVGELDAELRKVDLTLSPGRGLKTALEGLHPGGTNLAQIIGDGSVSTTIAHPPDLAQKAASGQIRKSQDALAQIGFKGVDQPVSRLPRPVNRRNHTGLQMLAHRLAIKPELAGNGRDRKPLPLQVMDHDNFPKSDHPLPPVPVGKIRRCDVAVAELRGHAPAAWRSNPENWGIFKRHFWGRYVRH